MFRLVLSCALSACCVAPAAAELITISEGHHPQVNLNPNRELLFTGGTIEYLNNVGGLATIDGGTLTGHFDTRPRSMRGGTTIFRGSGTPRAQHLSLASIASTTSTSIPRFWKADTFVCMDHWVRNLDRR